MRISLFAVLCLIVFGIQAGELPNSKRDLIPLSVFENAVIGAVSAGIEVGLNQPWFAWKVRKQDGVAIPWRRLRELYRGVGPNLSSMVLGTTTQVAVNGVVRSRFSDEPTKMQQVGIALGAGAVSAPGCSLSELLATQSQIHNKSVIETIRNIIARKGVKGLARGLGLTALREGGFTVGYLALPDVYYPHVVSTVPQEHVARIISGLAAGCTAGMLTQWIDTTKTRIQSDAYQDRYKNAADALVKIVKNEGVGALFKGAVPRIGRICLATVILDYSTNNLTAAWVAWKQDDVA